MKELLAGIVAAVLSVFGGHQAVSDSASNAAAAAASVAPSAIVATSSATNSSSPGAGASSTIVYQTINQPLIERIVERTVQTAAPSGYVTQEAFTTAINELSDRFGRIISGSTYPAPASNFGSGGVWNAVALTNRIDHLSGTSLTDITVDGVSGLIASDVPDLSGAYLSITSTTTARSTLGLSYASSADIADNLSVAAWGDSLTDGNQDTTGVSYPSVLTSLMGRYVLNDGVAGETSTQIKVRMLADTDKYSWPTIIWAGRNNVTDPSTIKSDIAAMVAALTMSNYIIVGVLNSSAEPTGSTNYTTIVQLNNDLATTYGSHFIDIRSYLVSLYDPNQAQDVTDHSNDVVPSSLRTDTVHLKAAGYTEVAQRIYQEVAVLTAERSDTLITTQNAEATI